MVVPYLHHCPRLMKRFKRIFTESASESSQSLGSKATDGYSETSETLKAGAALPVK